jgi:regulatory protein
VPGHDADDAEAAPVLPARVKAIEEHGRKAGRFTVRLETAPGQPRGSARSATVSAELLERLGLRVGASLDVPQVVALRDAAAALATYDRALNLLAFRARSSADLRRKLVEKGEPPALAEQAVAKLEALGLLNDEDYARQVARGKLLGGASRRRVQQELWRRGVTRDVADDAVADVVADEDVDEEGSAAAVARRKVASLAKLDAPTRRRRLYAFLARRGYDHAAIRAAMKAALEPGDADGDADGDGDGDDVGDDLDGAATAD